MIRKKAAMQLADEWEKLARKARQKSLTESAVRAKVEDVIAEIMETATGRPFSRFTTREWMESWLRGKASSKAHGTALRYKVVVERFLSSVGPKADEGIHLVTPDDILRYRELERKRGKGSKTCNSDLKILRGPFNSARRQGIITTNPAEAVEMLPEDDASPKDLFTSAQIQALLAVADSDWKTAILLGNYTGQRLTDVTDLKWGDVDLHERCIRFRQKKTRQTVLIPIHDVLQDRLLDLPAPATETAPLMPSLSGKSTAGKSGLSMKFSRLMDAAKIQNRTVRERKGEGRTTRGLTFQSLRHSFNSALMNAGIPQEQRQLLTGHASKAMNDRYSHPELALLAIAVAKLPRHDG